MRSGVGIVPRYILLFGVWGLLGAVVGCDGTNDAEVAGEQGSSSFADAGEEASDSPAAATMEAPPAPLTGDGSSSDPAAMDEEAGSAPPPTAMASEPEPLPMATPGLDAGIGIGDGGDGGMPDPAEGPSLAAIVTDILTPSCLFGRCHVTAAPAAGLSFTGRRISVYEALVNAPSQTVSGRIRVVPYDPDASYLMEKLTSDQPAFGESMPPMARLTPENIERIRQWIVAGAPDN